MRIVSFLTVGPAAASGKGGKPYKQKHDPDFELPLPMLIYNSALTAHTSDSTKVD